MAQITIYLDDDHESKLRAAAKAAGVPVSRWVAALIEEKTATTWPDSVRSLAGTWPEFPELDEIRADSVPDGKRESL